jgi:hypothetical protein
VKVVDRIELRGRNEVFKRQADLEKTLEARKARKQVTYPNPLSGFGPVGCQ